MNQNRILVLLSGGADSTTALYQAVKEGKRVHALTVRNESYADELPSMDVDGPETLDEIGAEGNVARVNYRLPAGRQVVHRVLDLTPLIGIMPRNTVVECGGTSGDQPSGTKPGKHRTPATNCVPTGKVGMPLSYELVFVAAAAYAAAHGISQVVWAVHADDFADAESRQRCAEDLAELSALLSRRCGSEITIATPYIGMSKADVMELGISLGVDYSLTYSCREGTVEPCGSCHQCARRMKAESDLAVRRAARGGLKAPREPHIPPITNEDRERNLAIGFAQA